MMETMEISRSVCFSRNSAELALPRKNQINTSVSKITEAGLSQLHYIGRDVAHVFSILPKSKGLLSAQTGSLRGRQRHDLSFRLSTLRHNHGLSALHCLQIILDAVAQVNRRGFNMS